MTLLAAFNLKFGAALRRQPRADSATPGPRAGRAAARRAAGEFEPLRSRAAGDPPTVRERPTGRLPVPNIWNPDNMISRHIPSYTVI